MLFAKAYVPIRNKKETRLKSKKSTLFIVGFSFFVGLLHVVIGPD
jgi:hypothetical protein